MDSLLRWMGAALLCISACGAAEASSPAEKLVCTQAPRAEWMPEQKIREIFGDKEYALVKFKISRGNCYEFYAIHRDGSVVEAYHHPVSGAVMRQNRVSSQPAAPTYESRGAAPGGAPRP